MEKWIRISTECFNDPKLTGKPPFIRLAWIDLLLMAKRMTHGGHLSAGMITPAFLAAEWGCSTPKARAPVQYFFAAWLIRRKENGDRGAKIVR